MDNAITRPDIVEQEITEGMDALVALFQQALTARLQFLLDGVQIQFVACAELSDIDRKCKAYGIPRTTTFAYPGYGLSARALPVFIIYLFS